MTGERLVRQGRWSGSADYSPPELFERPYFVKNANMTIIATLNL